MLNKEEYSEIEFSDQDFSGNNFSEKIFEECVFRNCSFDNVNFTGCIFENCVFESCSLILPTLRNATLDNVEFRECKITGLNFGDLNDFSMSFEFSKSKLLSCTFTGLELKYTSFNKSVIIDSVFRECNLHKSDFQEVEFRATSFSGNDLTSSNFRDATGFFINPCDNRMKGAKFTYSGALELLTSFEIDYL